MKKVLLGISLAITSMAAQSQINVFSGNTVGIGPGLTSSASSLSINSNSVGLGGNAVTLFPLSNHTTGLGIGNLANGSSYTGLFSGAIENTAASSVMRGIWGYALGSTIRQGQSYGVMGTAGNATYNYGVWGNLLGTQNGAAIYGIVGSAAQPLALSQQYAGYFVGDAAVTGKLWVSGAQVQGSDKKLKKNIAVLDSSDRIYTLMPKKYNLKTKKELIADGSAKASALDTAKTTLVDDNESSQEYIKKQHYGFLAQDLQKVYPDLVYTSGDGTLGVDYIGLIPIIVAQMQTLKKQLDAKEARIVALEKAVAKLTK